MPSDLPPPRPPLTPEGFRKAAGVSRETCEQLQAYLDLLQRWQRRINLVGGRTLEDPWRRHFLDSAQLLPLLPGGAPHVLDVGSGAGFPGLVLAILGVENVTLVDSDKRKCAFLREAARVTGARVTVHAERIEALAGRVPQPDVITARAVAPLSLLLNRTKLFFTPNLICLFPKGRRAEEELTAMQTTWHIETGHIETGHTEIGQIKIERFPSITDPSGTILRLTIGKDYK